MVVQFKAISKRTTQQAEQIFHQRAAALRALAAEKIAEAIVYGSPEDSEENKGSPVDTATYVMAHIAGAGASAVGGTRRSDEPGRQRGRNINQFRALALGNLKRSVSSAAVTASPEIWFRNQSEHAKYVELGWPTRDGYHVYAKAQAYAHIAIREAIDELGFRRR